MLENSTSPKQKIKQTWPCSFISFFPNPPKKPYKTLQNYKAQDHPLYPTHRRRFNRSLLLLPGGGAADAEADALGASLQALGRGAGAKRRRAGWGLGRALGDLVAWSSRHELIQKPPHLLKWGVVVHAQM